MTPGGAAITGAFAVRGAVTFSLVLWPIGVLPFALGYFGTTYCLGIVVAFGGYLALAFDFAQGRCKTCPSALIGGSFGCIGLVYLSLLIDFALAVEI
jgi:hypothetical protein